MIRNRSTALALAAAALLAAVTLASAQTATPDPKPPVKKVKHHAHKAAMQPASDMYLRAAGSEPAPKAK